MSIFLISLQMYYKYLEYTNALTFFMITTMQVVSYLIYFWILDNRFR
jgi:hypothetical protein